MTGTPEEQIAQTIDETIQSLHESSKTRHYVDVIKVRRSFKVTYAQLYGMTEPLDNEINSLDKNLKQLTTNRAKKDSFEIFQLIGELTNNSVFTIDELQEWIEKY